MRTQKPSHRLPGDRLALPAAVLAALLTTAAATAQEKGRQQGDVAADAVKAAFVLKFASYVQPETPRPATAPVRIGFVGDDPTAATARKILPGKTLGAARVEVIALTFEQALAGAHGCHLLYVGSPIEPGPMTKLIHAHARTPTALLSEQPGFAAAGGGIQLFVQDKNIRFEVNAEALRRQGLQMSSQVLKHSIKGPVR
jgi:hypothetical protein